MLIRRDLAAANPAKPLLDLVVVEQVSGHGTGRRDLVGGEEAEQQPLSAADRAIAARRLDRKGGVYGELHNPAVAAT